jgi:hypothetical protein
MRRRDEAGRKAVKARRGKTLTLKRRNAPKVARRRKPSADAYQTSIEGIYQDLLLPLDTAVYRRSAWVDSITDLQR